MKVCSCFAAILMTMSIPFATAADAEIECRRFVKTTLEAFDMVQQSSELQPTLKGLSADQIRAIEQEKGSCAAKQAIYSKYMESAPATGTTSSTKGN